jgi:hypothetical protein
MTKIKQALLSEATPPVFGTYTAIAALKNSNSLVPGAYYTITDFQTIHIIPNTSALCVQGIVYEIKGDWTNSGSEGVEPLTLKAINGNTFAVDATSTNNPTDIIYFDFTKNLCEDNVTQRKGQITYRKNTTYNIEAYFDWMNHKFRRWKINPQSYNAATTYNANDIVANVNTIYICQQNGTVGIPLGSDPKRWLTLYDRTGFSGYGILTDWVATTPTNFKIAGYAVPVDASSFTDFLAISRAIGADGRSHSLILSQGVLNNIIIGKCVTDPNLYNNIVICIGNTAFPFYCKNVRFGANCKNMTFSFALEDSTFHAACYDNLFRYAIIQSQFFGQVYNCCLLYHFQKVVAMSEFFNVVGSFSYCFFGRYVYNSHFNSGANNFVCTNEIEGCKFGAGIGRLDAVHLYRSNFWGVLTDIKFTVGVKNVTINGTYDGYNRVVNMVSPDGSLWASAIDDTGHFSPEKII